jgi:hypothetical protein
VLPAPYTSNAQARLALDLPQAQQGRRLSITSFAWDQSDRIGYSLKTNTQAPQATEALAWADSSLVVYGRTYSLPRPGVAGDITVDAIRGNVFVSNTSYNLIEVWNNQQQGFTPNGVAVGSMPWGMFVSPDLPDELLVANSGATTISRVNINQADPTQIREVLTSRIRTRDTYVWTVTFSRDESTGKITLRMSGPFSYSDRPQYVARSQGGRIFFSTRPTETAPAGTIRWVDPNLAASDTRQIWQYGSLNLEPGTSLTYAVFNADGIRIGAAPTTGPLPDTLIIYDHPYGLMAPTDSALNPIPMEAQRLARAWGSDVELVLGLDVSSLPLTDTTFAAASGNGAWIGFGEGNVKRPSGRVIMVNDPPGPEPAFYSPVLTVKDLTDNASEKVFGLAIDSLGWQVASHGLQSYFAALDNPFHLRLEGKYDSFDNGAGVAFHPRANSVFSAPENRLAFVASASGSIEIVDVSYYITRGRLLTKSNLYGPLRATRPLPGDPPEVVLKLYGLTSSGLVVINLTAADIKPGP